MTDKDDAGKSELSKFMDSLQSGYEKENEKRSDLSIKSLSEGAATGVAESLVHPFRWARSIFRK